MEAHVKSEHVYISYAQRDSERAKEICEYLEATGIKCWIAPRDILPGQEWASGIVSGIKESGAFMLVVSQEVNRSLHVAREIMVAADHAIPIIPLKVGPVELTGPMSFHLSAVQWFDLTKDRFKDGLKAVARAVAPLVLSGPVQPEPLSRIAQAQPTKGYVFISYNREDHDFVVRLREILKRRGYAYWDYSESERDYHNALYRELEEKIENAAAFMCVVTDSWRDSEWPAAEYIYAREAKVPVFVIQAKRLARPVPIILNQQTRIDMASDFARGAVILEHELDKKKL